jgi:CsoR family transcriptional regulator, copper-sensing transcriptional repressor
MWVHMDNMISSLNRIEGQVRGVRKMYQENRECAAIVQQIAAIQSALKRVGKEMLTSEACACSDDAEQQKKISDIIDSLVKIG